MEPVLLVIGVRVGPAHHDGDRRRELPAVDVDGEVGLPSGVVAEQLPEHRGERRTLVRALGRRELSVEPLHRGGVEAGTAVDREGAPVRAADSDPPRGAGERLLDHAARRLHGVERQAERAHQDVRRAARQHAERDVGPREPVDDLVDRAVAGEDDHELHLSALHRLAGDLGRVAALERLQDVELEVGREGLLDDGEDGGGDGARDGVGDQQGALEAEHEAPILSGSHRNVVPTP